MKNQIYKIINLFVIFVLCPTLAYAGNHPDTQEWIDKNDDGFDDKTALDKDGYANPNIPIPSSTTEFKLRRGAYTTEDGTKLKVSTETKIARNPDGSFNIGDDKVSGSDIEYNNGQHTIIGKGSLNNIPLSNVKNVHYISSKEGISVEIAGEVGDEPSSFDGTIIKPKGTIFVYRGTRSYVRGSKEDNRFIEAGEIISYSLEFKTDAVLSEIGSDKTAYIIADKGKVRLPNGYTLESGKITYDKGQAYVGFNTKINGVLMSGGGVQFDPERSIKLFFDKEIPNHVETGISISKDSFIVKIRKKTEYSPSAYIEMAKDNPYTKTDLSFNIKDGRLEIRRQGNKPANFIRLIGNADMWNEKYLISSDGKEVKAYADSFIRYKRANDINVEILDMEERKLLPANIKITKDGRLVGKGLTMTSKSDLENKYNLWIYGDPLSSLANLEDALAKNPERKDPLNLYLVDFKTIIEKCGFVHGCAPNLRAYILKGSDSGTIFHEVSHNIQQRNDIKIKLEYEQAYKEAREKGTLIYEGMIYKLNDEEKRRLQSEDFTWNWELVAGNVYNKGDYREKAMPHPGGKDNSYEDVAYFAESVHFPKNSMVEEEWFIRGINPKDANYDPRIKAKLKLLVGAIEPFMSKEQYQKVTGEPYSPLTDDEILVILKLQEQRDQLTKEGKLELERLKGIKKTK